MVFPSIVGDTEKEDLKGGERGVPLQPAYWAAHHKQGGLPASKEAVSEALILPEASPREAHK